MVPCPRDGSSLAVVGNQLVVYGGDRYQMAFNDCYIFDAGREGSIQREEP